MTDYKPITRSIMDTYCPNGIRIHVGETEDGEYQLHYYKKGILQIVKKCYHKNDAIQQHGQYLIRYYTMETEPVKAITKKIGVYKTVEFTPPDAFDPKEKRTLETLIRIINTPVYIRYGTPVINYKNKVFRVHKNTVPMAMSADVDYVFNIEFDVIKIEKKNVD